MLDDPPLQASASSTEVDLSKSSHPRHAALLEVGDRLGGAAWPHPSGDLRTSPPQHPLPVSFVLPTPLSKPPAQPTPFYFRYPVQRQQRRFRGSQCPIVRKKSLAYCTAPHNGSSNRLRRRQPLWELRSRATGLGGWESANEEGVGGARATKMVRTGAREIRELVPLWRGQQVVRLRTGRLDHCWTGGAEGCPVRERGGDFRPSCLPYNHRVLRVHLSALSRTISGGCRPANVC